MIRGRPLWPLRRRLVRLHVVDDGPSVEGVLSGIRAGHYVLRDARLLTSAESSTQLDGRETWVPRSRVVLVQLL